MSIDATEPVELTCRHLTLVGWDTEIGAKVRCEVCQKDRTIVRLAHPPA